ncbi:hypothetical protein UFOVP640_20 [uncultured Caudovirales phage]|uniref:Bacteriophage lambda, GpH, tail tape measure, C-terminal n=1 Tax=uncultured Caudovirales phage TaxID=2100421 RepID=A0A6J5N285_9CAUD|nr:hypothetical protein UFOVP640_20 [uncultured Caudovirales phage]CAB5226024.1 hypothetical protein UFOVP759_24 [uncultured Caudovirales phage]
MATEVKLTADASQLVQEVKKAEAALKGLQDIGAGVGKALLGVTAAAAGLGYAVKGILDSAGALFDAAETIGISVQSLQVFQKAAGEVGVSAEELNGSLMKMNANIGEALITGTGGAAKALERMGISLDQINGMKPDKQFELLAKKLSEIPNAGERAALAMDLFGKQGQKVLKIAEGLDEMRKKMEALGMLISPEQQASLDLAGDAVDGLIGLFSTGLKKAVADLAPYIIGFANAINDAVKAAGGLENVIAVVGGIMRYAFNVAIIYGMARGFLAVQTAITAAGGAMAVFNTIVKRSPFFLLVAGAAALAQYLGLDIIGAMGKFLDASGQTAKAQDEIAEAAEKIRKENEAAGVAAKRGNSELEKQQKSAREALVKTIAGLENEAQFQKEKISLGETEATIQKAIRAEAEKLALVQASFLPGQRERLENALREVESGKANAEITNTMKSLQDEILVLTTAEGVEREKITAQLALERSIKRELGTTEKDALAAAIQRREVLKVIGDQEKQNKQYAIDAKVSAGMNAKLLQLDKELAAGKKAIADATTSEDKARAEKSFADTATYYQQELRLASFGFDEKTRLEVEYERGKTARQDIQARLEIARNTEGFTYRVGLLEQLAIEEDKAFQKYASESYAAEVRNADVMKSIRLSNLQIVQTAELDAARVKYANLEVMAFEHQQALKDIELKAAEDKMSMELQKVKLVGDVNLYSADEAKKIAADKTAFEKKSAIEQTSFALDQAGQMFSALGAQNKSAFEAAKAFNIANAIMNTYMAATKALATYPPPFNFIAMGAAVAMGLAQVAQIRSQQYSGRALGGPVMGGQPYLVGENGPELFTPANTGSITRNDQLGGGGTTNVTFNITATDTNGFDKLLVARRGLITEIIRDAQLDKGRRI